MKKVLLFVLMLLLTIGSVAAQAVSEAPAEASDMVKIALIIENTMGT